MIDEVVELGAEERFGPEGLFAVFLSQARLLAIADLIVEYDMDLILLVETFQRKQIFMVGPLATVKSD